MRSLLGAIAGLLIVLAVISLFPPKNNEDVASAVALPEPPTQLVQSSAEPVETVEAPEADAQTVEDLAQSVPEEQTEPASFDPRRMTLAELKDRRVQALEAQQRALDEDHQAAMARHSDIKAYGLAAARDAAFDDATRDTAKAHRLACIEADLQACTALADIYIKGSGVTSDQPLAVALYTLACEDGFNPACVAIESAQYSYTDRSMVEGEPRLTSEEVAAIRAARRASVTLLEDALADHNDDFRPDYYGRVTRVKDGCRAGHAADCVQLGRYFYTEYASTEQWGVKHDVPDLEAGRALYLHACELGDAYGCWSYAEAHYGMGERDVPEIYLAYYEKSCDMGFGLACQQLGYNYESGHHFPEDAAKASMLYNRGCDLGDAYSCSSLSSLWDLGDEQVRVTNKLRACLHGESQTCEFLSDDFSQGRGDFPKDPAIARELLVYGCEDEIKQHDDPDRHRACKTLARMDS